ncbi:hypothetical protein LOZ39_001882 [Ophidiomyces ophidiicola]|nr:hypothetical protein LOZ61_005146 [Ophidiomyces ophidiicola]KAI1928329.1 hypothetical protein LOZ60_002426 [Ophidiomyces ophidiicola]KAI2015186.1 hypothetical protein LOZ49_000793 [Ophidiomyces ophidiicola]KAI2057789.1 hypothetical protein LOZ44_001272 [Ophidiomyces ophidiicola]KAI2077885.1 hypothetical protein LOZ39_001882 [Ophidiomyces ophidiicola]
MTSSASKNEGDENTNQRGSHIEDAEKENAQLVRGLQERHLQMIAIGGSIGAGLFIGSGKALSSGGPASLFLGFILIGIMVLCCIQSLAEMAVLYPVNGAFYIYSSRFIDPGWGFALGWQYAVGWLLTLPFEITAAGITIKFWRSDINIGVWVAVFLGMLILVQFFGIKGYGESEFILALIKVIACTALIILGIIINVGGVPTDNRGYIGGRYWRDPGSFRNGFKGFVSVLVAAAFAYGGAEMVGLAAAETVHPHKSIPKASRQVLWRIVIFYVVNILLIGLNVPSDSPVLLGAKGGNTKASAFVLATQLAGIKALPSVINAVITISVLSVANTCSFASTRTLQALASTGNAPKIFAYIDSKGRPLWCIVLQILFGLLAFVNEIAAGEVIFSWLLALGGLSSLIISASICLSHIRFRRAWKIQGRNESDIPYRSPLGVTGSRVGFLVASLAIIATFYLGIFVSKSRLSSFLAAAKTNSFAQPITSKSRAESFFKTCLSGPLIVIVALCWKIYSRDWSFGVDLQRVDLDDGLRMDVQVNLSSPETTEEEKLSTVRRISALLF